MKRIQSACLEQTIRFESKEEFEKYKIDLEKKRVIYKICEEKVKEDGFIVVKIKRQYNSYDCSDYINC